MALAAFSAALGLIYTYYMSVEDRNAVEQAVADALVIEPYEVQELRHCNGLTASQYVCMVDHFSKNNYEDGLIRYDHFVQVLHKHCAIQVRFVVKTYIYIHIYTYINTHIYTYCI